MAAPTASSAPTCRRASAADGADHPLMIALHGGSGNASQMMADNHGIIAAAEAGGYVGGLSGNGLPRSQCSSLPCLDNNWSQPENVFFVAELLPSARRRPAGSTMTASTSSASPAVPEADLHRHRRHPRFPGRHRIVGDGRRRLRPVPRRPARRGLRRHPASGGRARSGSDRGASGERRRHPRRRRRRAVRPPPPSARQRADHRRRGRRCDRQRRCRAGRGRRRGVHHRRGTAPVRRVRQPALSTPQGVLIRVLRVP